MCCFAMLCCNTINVISTHLNKSIFFCFNFNQILIRKYLIMFGSMKNVIYTGESPEVEMTINWARNRGVDEK